MISIPYRQCLVPIAPIGAAGTLYRSYQADMEDVQHAATPRSAAGSSRADSESLPVWKISATPEALKLSVDDLSASIEAIPNLVTSERQAVLAALDDKESALTGTVAKLRGALTEAIAVLHQVEPWPPPPSVPWRAASKPSSHSLRYSPHRNG